MYAQGHSVALGKTQICRPQPPSQPEQPFRLQCVFFGKDKLKHTLVYSSILALTRHIRHPPSLENYYSSTFVMRKDLTDTLTVILKFQENPPLMLLRIAQFYLSQFGQKALTVERV